MRTRVNFEAGKCLSVEVRIPGAPGQPAQSVIRVVPELVGAGLLSLTDRIILDQIAARVHKLSFQIADAAGENWA